FVSLPHDPPSCAISTLSLHDALPIWRSSSALDASTVFGNPAGMSRLGHRQVTGGLALIDPHVKIKHGRTADAVGNAPGLQGVPRDRKSTRLNSSHVSISYAVFCLKKK